MMDFDFCPVNISTKINNHNGNPLLLKPRHYLFMNDCPDWDDEW